MPGHIGIAACSAEGAALCYRTICHEGAAHMGAHGHPEISMHTPPLADYVARLAADDRQGVADLMLASARKLDATGADFVICPDNTIHLAMDLVTPASPLPWLHIADEVASIARQNGWRRLGLLGTRWLVESRVYPSALDRAGVGWLRPGPDEIAAVDRLIFDDLVPGHFSDTARDTLEAMVDTLADRGCDAVVLGCTELPLSIRAAHVRPPVIDSTRVLARAALERAMGQ